MEDRKGENPRQSLLTSGLNQQKSEVGKLASRAMSLILRSIPVLLCYGWLKLTMQKVLTISLFQHL